MRKRKKENFNDKIYLKGALFIFEKHFWSINEKKQSSKTRTKGKLPSEVLLEDGEKWKLPAKS